MKNKWNDPNLIDSVLPDGVVVCRPLIFPINRETKLTFIDPDFGYFNSTIRGLVDAGRSTHPTKRAFRTNNTIYGDPIKRNEVINKRLKTTEERYTKEELLKKQIEGNRTKFGKDWASSTPEFRDKVKDTCLKKYGIDNVAKVPEFNVRAKKTRSVRTYLTKKIVRDRGPGKYEDNLIYALVDPRTKIVRYIGKSTSGMNRPKNHIKPSHLIRDNTYKGNWIRFLKKQHLTPEIVVLQYTEHKGDLDSLERQYILLYRALGAPLTNLTNGGESTYGVLLHKE